MRARLALVLVLALAPHLRSGQAQAQESFALPSGTAPRSLLMRASAFRVAAAQGSQEESAAEEPEGEDENPSIFSLPGTNLDLQGGRLDQLVRHKLEQDVLAPPKSLSESLIFRFNLGMGLDGGQPSGLDMLSGSELDEINDYERLRIYSFGDTVLGSRDVGMQGLNSYFAAHFRYNQSFGQSSTALPSIYDQDFQQPVVRSAYAELDNAFELPRLKPLYFRAGRSFKYGLTPVHFNGLTIGYDTPALKLSVYGGQRVNLYALEADLYTDQGVLSGADIRADLFAWRRWPLVVFASTLSFDEKDHFRTGLALRWHRDVLVSSALRSINGKRARLDLAIRARISEVTTVNFKVSDRTRSDWSFGMLHLETPDSAADPRRYLDLGPVLPRTHLSLRYGTVLLRNLDVLLRAGGAIDRRDRDLDAPSSYSSSYAEGGGAVEVHVRRTLRVGAAISTRRYFLSDTKAENAMPGQADPLPADLGSTGASSFLEGGMNLIYNAGARRFGASAEFYGRRYSYRSEYLLENESDFRSGGRFSVEGWASKRLRLRTEYDVSLNRMLMAPELNGLKSLRVLMEGSF